MSRAPSLKANSGSCLKALVPILLPLTALIEVRNSEKYNWLFIHLLDRLAKGVLCNSRKEKFLLVLLSYTLNYVEYNIV